MATISPSAPVCRLKNGSQSTEERPSRPRRMQLEPAPESMRRVRPAERRVRSSSLWYWKSSGRSSEPRERCSTGVSAPLPRQVMARGSIAASNGVSVLPSWRKRRTHSMAGNAANSVSSAVQPSPVAASLQARAC